MYLGHKISIRTVRRIMTEHGIFPTDWTKTHDWQGFFEAHKDVLAATDFLTHEILTPDGLQRVHVLMFEDITSREVWCGGITADPNLQGAFRAVHRRGGLQDKETADSLP